MKKFYVLFLIFTVNFNVFALSVDCTAVPWTTGLRLRDSASTRGKELGFLGIWEKLKVLEIKQETETIGGNRGNWVKVRREDSLTTGWCFSYFLEEIDPDNFFPVLEYRYTIGELYTFYNDGKKREKLTLYWNNKIIEKFDELRVSDNGRVIAFNWTDTATIKRNSREGTMTGTRYLFVYNFASHNTARIDEVIFSQSDKDSERWADGSWDMGYEYADGFTVDTRLYWFSLNSNGTKIFYGKDNAGIEVDSTKSARTTHQINREGHQIGRYYGDYISLGTSNRRKIELYNPSEKKTITGFHGPSDPNDPDGSYYRPLIIRENRYLVVEQDDNNFKGMLIHDLSSNQKRQLKNIDLSYNRNEYYGVYSVYHNDFYIVMAAFHKEGSPGSYIIRKVDYNNNILSVSAFNKITYKMTSYSFSVFAAASGLIEFQHGNGESWMTIFLFNEKLLQYRMDDRIYKGYNVYYLMRQ